MALACRCLTSSSEDSPLAICTIKHQLGMLLGPTCLYTASSMLYQDHDAQAWKVTTCCSAGLYATSVTTPEAFQREPMPC